MLKIGLTGGIGSGKSTVSKILKEKGFNIIDADIVAREVLDIYPEILLKVKEKFGKSFFDKNGKLIRKKFGNFIFSVKETRKDYENIIMPFIIKEIFYRILKLDENGEKICILDAPTLIENGLDKHMDINILVWVDLSTQLERIKIRDKLTYEEALMRINAQMPLKEKIKLVDYIIDNSKSLKNTEKEVEKILDKIFTNIEEVKCHNNLSI